MGVNNTLKFIDLLLIVPMLLENLKSKKTQNVCVEIWLHPLHPLFSVQCSVFSLQKKKWQLAFTTFDFFEFRFRIVGWFGKGEVNEDDKIQGDLRGGILYKHIFTQQNMDNTKSNTKIIVM